MTEREDINYIRDRVDNIYEELSEFKIDMAGFKGKVWGVAVVLSSVFSIAISWFMN